MITLKLVRFKENAKRGYRDRREMYERDLFFAYVVSGSVCVDGRAMLVVRA
jgi:hypothetical protein